MLSDWTQICDLAKGGSPSILHAEERRMGRWPDHTGFHLVEQSVLRSARKPDRRAQGIPAAQLNRRFLARTWEHRSQMSAEGPWIRSAAWYPIAPPLRSRSGVSPGNLILRCV